MSNSEEHIVWLSLGCNLPYRGSSKQLQIVHAVGLLRERAGRVVRQSSFYLSEPWGFSSENGFVNEVVVIKTSLSAERLLDITQSIERELGRAEHDKSSGYADREMDIDILLFDKDYISTERLTVPHPLMWQRDFVKKPMDEICLCSR